MKKEDIIILLIRMFICLFIFLPIIIFLYDHPIRFLSVVVVSFITLFIVGIYYKNKVTDPSEIIRNGKIFGWTSLILAFFMFIAGILAYIKHSEIPPPIVLIIFGLFTVCIILFFYYSTE